MVKEITNVAAASPKLRVSAVNFNCNEIIKVINQVKDKADIIVFPELSVTGASCGDLFLQEALINACKCGIESICNATKGFEGYVIIGSPVKCNNKLFNCGVVISNGNVLSVIPKQQLSLNERRWFSDAVSFESEKSADLPFQIIIGEEKPTEFNSDFVINISAIPSEVTQYDKLKDYLNNCSNAYVYSSAGSCESTTDGVYSGACLIYENGTNVAEGVRYSFESEICFAAINLKKCHNKRTVSENNNYNDLTNPSPFIPDNKAELYRRCDEILEIQSTGLAKRMLHTHTNKLVLGISGGLDSTQALLVAVKSMQKLSLPIENLICITMPGFGTTDLTYTNACKLVNSIGATLMEINIKEACLQHFTDIGHDASLHDVTYENTQARERTQILMDYSNKIGGLLVGTGDLSELALGWCTYNGDHMSMYGVNASVPKTLMQHLVRYVADNSAENVAKILYRVLDTPISPELLPPDKNGKMEQKTENTLGPYEVHDYFIYHFVRFNRKPSELLENACTAFDGFYTKDELKNWLEIFLKRFFNSQFKRSCMPDGPAVGSVSLSPRGAFIMPSDACYNEWLNF